VRLPVVGRVVDDDVADAQVVEVSERPLEALRVDGGLQPQVRIVRDGERLVVAGDGDQGHDRPEGLVAVDQRVGADLVDYGWLVVETRGAPIVARPTDYDLSALSDCVLEVRVHLLCGRLVVHRPDEGVVVVRVAQLPALGFLDDGGQELVVHPLVDEHALGRAAHLAGAEEAAEDGALRGRIQVGVFADDHRPVAARLDQ
jgi:hypothetical protein